MTGSESGRPAPRRSRIPARLSHLIVAEPHEVPAVLAGFLLFFVVFTGFFMLRPVRETMGIAGGVRNLQWLFLATFIGTLIVVPIYGALSVSVPRRRLLAASYLLGAVILVGFGIAMMINPKDVWAGRVFYVWYSVFNLFMISLAWSVMADVFHPDQAKRLFAQMAAGASLGGLTGPLLGGLLVGTIGHSGLLFLSAGLVLSTLLFAWYLFRWRDVHGDARDRADDPDRALGGSIVAGLTLIMRSPYLLAISVFVVLLASVSTFLYFEQARLVAITFPDRVRQTQVFSTIDVIVQTMTIFIQIFVTGRLTRRLGVTVLLTAVPLAMMAGFGLLAQAGTFPVLAGVMILRRVGEYALVRPGREMLFTAVDSETKYKAKNAIDTVVYRGGDAVSAWIKTAVDAVSTSPAAAAIVGMGLAAAWAALGFGLGRTHDQRTEPVPRPA